MRESIRSTAAGTGAATAAFSLLVIVAVGLAMGLVAPAGARAAADDDKEWKVLGETTIEQPKGGQGKRGGRGEGAEGGAAGEIEVSASEGLVKRIKLEVRGAEVEFKKITVTYEEGDPEEVEVREKVRNRGRTRTIDLKGGNRAIKKVVLAYKAEKADNDSDREARIILLGHK